MRNNSGINIRRLNYENKTEVSRAAELMKKAFKQSPWKVRRRKEFWREKVNSWPVELRRKQPHILVAKANGEVVGVAVSHLQDKREDAAELRRQLGKGKHYYMRFLAVHPRHQRRGVGSRLMRANIKRARELRCDTIYGPTITNNRRMRRRFENMGFGELLRIHRERSSLEGLREATEVYYVKEL